MKGNFAKKLSAVLVSILLMVVLAVGVYGAAPNDSESGAQQDAGQTESLNDSGDSTTSIWPIDDSSLYGNGSSAGQQQSTSEDNGETVVAAASNGTNATVAARSPNKTYATDATIDIKSITLGNAGNIPNETLNIATGELAVTSVVFNITKTEGGAIAPGGLMFRVRITKGLTPVTVSQNDNYTILQGGPGGPEDTTDDPNADYVWIIWNNEISSGEGYSFNFSMTPFANGTTPNGTEFPVEVLPYFQSTNAGSPTLAASSESINTNKYIAKADAFGWNNGSISANPSSSNNSSNGSLEIPTLTWTFNASNKNSASTSGLAHTGAVNFYNVFQVPVGSDGTPLVLLKAENLCDASGTPLSSANYEIIESKGDYITKFALKGTVLNAQADISDIANASLTFKLVGLTYNSNQIINVDGLDIGKNIGCNITWVSSNNTAVPAVAISGTGTAPVSFGNNAFTQQLTFYNKLETGKETEGNFKKELVSIGATDVQSGDVLAAFGTQLVSYSLGKGFTNKQKGAITELIFEDKVATAGQGYNASEIQPVTIYPGIYRLANSASADLSGAGLTIEVQYESSTEKHVIALDAGGKSNPTSNTPITISNPAQVKAIRFVFTNVEKGFYVYTAPQIVYEVQNQYLAGSNTELDPARHGDTFSNTATMQYKYSNPNDAINNYTSAPVSSTATFTYKIMGETEDGRYSYNKEGQNLANPGNPMQYPSKGDVLLYTITVTNESDSPVALDKLEDIHTNNLLPYGGDSIKNGSSTKIPDQYLVSDSGLPARNINFKLWRNVGGNFEPETNENIVTNITYEDLSGKQKFTVGLSGITLGARETVKFTYTMLVSSTFNKGDNLINDFVMYSGSKDISSGRFVWSEPRPVNTNKFKTWSNITPGITPAAKPVAGDILLFTITMHNDTNRTLTDMTIRDHYSAELMEAYHSLTGLNESHASYAALASGRKNDSSMNMTLLNAPNGFDANAITVTSDPANPGLSNVFLIKLGAGNSLAPGESIQLAYTLRVTDKAQLGMVLRNDFELIMGGKTITNGYCTVEVDANASKQGVLHIVKSAVGVETSEGVKPDTNNLLNGDDVKYTIDVANWHTRSGKDLNVRSFIDTIPANMVLDESTIQLNMVTIKEDGTRVTVPFDTDAYDYVIIPPGNGVYTTTLQVTLKNKHALESEMLTVNNASEAKNRIELVYVCTVDTTSDTYPALVSAQEKRTNTVKVFFEHTAGDLGTFNSASGTAPVEDTNNLDGVDATKSYSTNSATVQIYNEQQMRAGITKEVLSGKNINLDSGDLTTEYRVNIENNSLAPLDLSKIVDILPRYQSLTGEATIEIILPGETSGKVYTLKVEDVPGYKDASGAELNRVFFTGYSGHGENKTMVIPRAQRSVNNGVSTIKSTKAIIRYTAVTDRDAALADFRANEVHEGAYQNIVAMYMANPTVDIPSMIAGSKRTNDGEEATPTGNPNDWDSDPATVRCYYNTVSITIQAGSTAPFIGLIPYTVAKQAGGSSSTVEIYTPYNKQDISPADTVAWDVVVGNSNVQNYSVLPINEGAYIIVVLPSGLTFDGFGRDSAGQEQIPAYLKDGGAPKTFTAGDSTILVWEVDGRTFTAGQNNDTATDKFRIRTTTEDGTLTSYLPSAYWVPKAEDDQYFYNSVLKRTGEWTNTKYQYTDAWGDLSAYLGEEYANAHYVQSTAGVNVFGTLGISSNLTVSGKTSSGGVGSVSSNSNNRLLALASRDETITYTMELMMTKGALGFSDAVLINRLPTAGDTLVLSDKERGSTATARLLGNGNFTAQIVNINTGTPEPNFVSNLSADNSNWVVEYYVGDHNTAFTSEDFKNTSSSHWLAQTQMADEDYINVTAIRVRLIGDYKIPEGYKLKVTFQAKLNDYNISNLIGYDSFAFNGAVGANALKAELLQVGVNALVAFDRISLTKVLLDAHTTPRQTAFTITLNGYDTAGALQETHDVDVTVSQESSGRWVGTANLYNLPRGLIWEATEQAPANSKAPVITVLRVPNSDGVSATFQVDVTNEPYVHHVYYHANGGTGSQADSNSPYYRGERVTVLAPGSIQRQGYVFVGWALTPNGNAYYRVGDMFNITADVNLYAVWGTEDISSTSSRPITSRPVSSESGNSETPPQIVPSSGQSSSIPISVIPVVPDGGPNRGFLEQLVAGEVPLGHLSVNNAWSLLNLICSVVAIIVSIVLFITVLANRYRKDDNYDEEEFDNAYATDEDARQEDTMSRRRNWLKILSMVAGILLPILFLILENMRLPMVFINRWSPMFVVIFVIHIALMLIQLIWKKRKKQEPEEDEEFEKNFDLPPRNTD